MSDPKASSNKGAPPSPFPPQLVAGVAKAKAMWAALGKPVRILLGSTLVVVALISLWLGLRSAYEPYAILFTGLEADDAGAIVAKLKEEKIPYRVEGGSVEVPEAKVNELRLELASSGLPRGGGAGFESFDKLRLGATEFEQRVMYRRAMEGELGRTIGSVDAVQNARVHLVMPEKSVFAARREPASASIVVKLRAGRSLGGSEVAGIVHLTASAVPGLVADRITLVTTEGTMLHKPRASSGEGDDASANDGDRESAARAIESKLEDNARGMLEKVLGPGHVDVRASAEMDLARVEHLEDHYDPSKSILRSEEQTTERAAGSTNNDDKVAGVPGAESNLPTEKPGASPSSSAAVAAPPAPLAAGTVRESHTRNFEVDHVQEKRVSTTGTLKRITVAVVVDGITNADGSFAPRNRAELDKIASLVKSAVGASDARGDLVTVESVAFPAAEAAPLPEPTMTTAFVNVLPPKARKFAVPGVTAAGLMLLAGVILLARRSGKKSAANSNDEPAKQLPSAESEAPLLSAASAAAALTPAVDQRAEAVRRALEDPATAALVLRRWLGTASETEAEKRAA